MQKTNLRYPLLLLTSCLPAFLVTCGGSIPAGDEGLAADAADIVEDSYVPEPTTVDEDFRVIYGYNNSSGAGSGEMLIGNPGTTGIEGNPAWSDDFHLVKSSLFAIGLDCSLGCWPNRELSFMAVAVPTESTTMGMAVQVIAFDHVLGALPLLDQPVTDVRQLQIKDDTLVVSRFKSDCETSSGTDTTCFIFEQLDLSDFSAVPEWETLFIFPSAELLDDSMYSGRFRVGADGNTLILQNPELDSVTFWLFDRNNGLRQVAGPICQTSGLDGECSYSANAPEMTDDAPVALTTDGRHLLLAYVEDNHDFRLASIDTTDGGMKWTSLLRTPADSISGYRTNACFNTTDVWTYTRIQQPLVLSADGSEVLFVAASECDPVMPKSFTNIIAVPIAEIGRDAKVDDDFYRMVTDFPAAPVPGCVSILPECLDLSPSGRFVAFAGTPVLDSTGRPILDTSPQHVTDREVFITASDGLHSPVQISGNVTYKASSVRCSVEAPEFAGITDPQMADE